MHAHCYATLVIDNAQVDSFVRPPADATKAVNEWLASHGVTATPINEAGNWLTFTVPVSKANKMFDADYSVVSHKATGKSAVRAASVSVPAELKHAINAIHPATSLFNPYHGKASGTVHRRQDGGNAQSVTPATVLQFYGVPKTAATASNNQIAVAGYIGQFAIQKDLTVSVHMGCVYAANARAGFHEEVPL